MGATSGKVALVANTTLLSGLCPTGSGIADMFGYGGAGTPSCFETTPIAALDNTTAAVRKGNGCIDTDNNSNDFVVIGPIPRNSSAPANICGGNPALPSGVGTATPPSVGPGRQPPADGHRDSRDLAGQHRHRGHRQSDQHRRQRFPTVLRRWHERRCNRRRQRVFVPHGGPRRHRRPLHSRPPSPTRRAAPPPRPSPFTVQSPTCGVERWSVKVGTDPDAGLVNLTNPVRSTIAALRVIPAPASPPLEQPRRAHRNHGVPGQRAS